MSQPMRAPQIRVALAHAKIMDPTQTEFGNNDSNKNKANVDKNNYYIFRLFKHGLFIIQGSGSIFVLFTDSSPLLNIQLRI